MLSAERVGTVTNSELSETDIPESRADLTWPEIGPFAQSFNAYDYWGSFAKVAEVAGLEVPTSLTDMRTKLFFEFRAWHHTYYDGDLTLPRSVVDLLEAIREKVRHGERD